MKSRRKRNGRFPQGRIKMEVLNIFFRNKNDPLSYSDVYSALKTRFKLKQKKGVERHMRDLRSMDLLVYNKKTRKFSLPKNYMSSFEFADVFIEKILGDKDFERNLGWLASNKIDKRLQRGILDHIAFEKLDSSIFFNELWRLSSKFSKKVSFKTRLLEEDELGSTKSDDHALKVTIERVKDRGVVLQGTDGR